MIKRKLLIISVIVIIFVAFFNIENTVNVVHESINIFYNFVLPYILPFLFIIQIFIRLKGGIFIAYYLQKITYKVLGLNGYETLISLCSILSGYPSISIYTESFYSQGKIDKKSALDLIYFSSFPSLFFVLGSMPKYLDNFLVPKLIFLSILLGGLLILKLRKNTCNFIKKDEFESLLKSYKKSDIFMIIKDSINTTITSILFIMFSYIFYSIIANLIHLLFPYKIVLILTSLLEFSNGVFVVSKLTINKLIKYNLIIFILCFGGLSILTQIDSFLDSIKLNYLDYFKAKIKHALVACIIFNILYIFFIIWSFLFPYLYILDLNPSFSIGFNKESISKTKYA